MHIVAIVDDDEQVRRSMGRLLRSVGYGVASFAGGAEFLASLDRATPACVLLDWTMPGMDGLEVLTRLSRRPARVPVIFVSGHASPEDRQAAISLGAVAVFGKPYNPAKLLAAIESAIADGPK